MPIRASGTAASGAHMRAPHLRPALSHRIAAGANSSADASAWFHSAGTATAASTQPAANGRFHARIPRTMAIGAVQAGG